MMVLERSVNKQKLAACQLEYSIKLNDANQETRGLMVIKQTNKTRARQRKQAIINWKVRKTVFLKNNLIEPREKSYSCDRTPRRGARPVLLACPRTDVR